MHLVPNQGPQAQGKSYRCLFNFEASKYLNAWLEPFSAVMMKSENHDKFLCIILKQKADQVMVSSQPVIALE